MRKLKYIISSILLLYSAVFYSQERPKIGLALSGGGAKGLAHAGILQAIDSAGLNIDYISGTSMGAILAAMYATGYTGKQIDSIASGMDWMQAMGSSETYSQISIENKDEYENYSIELNLEGFKLRPSTGVLEPQGVMLKFMEVFYPVYKIKDFSKLNIPFKCVATDLSNGDAVVIDKGNIPYAVRSSMAIPGVFSATNYKNTKLVDGGIVRNFPVRDVKEMGADFVIGVNLFNGLTQAKDMTSMIDVMLQVTNFRDASDLIYEKSICDMVLEPDVSKYSAASFGASKEILAIGDSIGREFYPLFKQLADSLKNVYGVQYSHKIKPYNPKVRIDGFSFEGLKHTNENMLIHNLNLKKGQMYSPTEINDAFRKAYSSLLYSNLTYELMPIDSLGVNLHCNVVETPLASVKFGLSYNTFTSASIILGYTRRNMLGRHSYTELKLGISEAMAFRIRNRHFFGAKDNNIFDAKYEFHHYYLPFYAERASKKDYIYSYFNNDFSLAYSHIFSPKSDVQFKLAYERFKVNPDITTGELTPIDGKMGCFSFNIRKRYNSLNRKFLPQSGAYIESNLYTAYDPNYHISGLDSTNTNAFQYGYEISDFKSVIRLDMNTNFYQSLSDRFILHEHIGFSALYGKSTLFHNTYLGGKISYMPKHFTFYGLNTAQRQEPSLATARIGLDARIMGELYASFNVNVAATFESVDTYIDNDFFDSKEHIYGGGLSVIYNFSRLPIDFTLMYSPEYKFNMYVNIGIPF